MAEKRYQMLEVLSFCDQEGLTSSNRNNSANFLGEKKYDEALWDVYFLTAEYSKKLEVKYRSCSRSRTRN